MDNKMPPGVMFWHRGAKLSEIAGQKTVTLTLFAQINDEDLWASIEKKFIEGFPVYAHEDFKGQIVSAMRSELSTTEAELASTKNQLLQKERENELLRQQLDEARAPMEALRERLERR